MYIESYTYQSTDAISIRKRHLFIHISRLIQSENGILLLFYIVLSHGNEKEKHYIFFKRGVWCEKGDAVSCPQAPVSMQWKKIHVNLANKTTFKLKNGKHCDVSKLFFSLYKQMYFGNYYENWKQIFHGNHDNVQVCFDMNYM